MSAITTLCRLRTIAAQNDCSILLAIGPESCDDEPSSLIIGCALPNVPPEDIVLLVTPRGASLHCPLMTWTSSVQALFEERVEGNDPELEVVAHVPIHVPGRGLDDDALLEFKLEAVRSMLERGNREASSGLAGFISLDSAVESWPLLRAACLSSPGLVEAMPPPPDVAKQFVRAARGVDTSSVRADGWAGQAVATIGAGWSALLGRLNRVGDAYDRGELSEKFMADSMLTAAAKASAASSAAPQAPVATAIAAGDCESGVWVGTRTGKACKEPSKKVKIGMMGAASNPSMHAIARLVDPAGSGVSVGRTLFFSNGRLPHHWQHRVFSDGEVFDPIVEDEVPPVERADETIRLMALYGVLANAVSQAATMAGAECPKRVSTSALNRMWYAQLSKAVEAKLLPEGFNLAEKASLTITRKLRPMPAVPPPPPPEAMAMMGPEDDRDGPTGGQGGEDAGMAEEDDDGSDGGKSPAQWYLHVISARLDGIPSIRWDPDVEGSLLFEETYALDGAGGARAGGELAGWALPSALTRGVPLLNAWPGVGGEESEARQVRGAVEQNAVCTKMHMGIERMRAGEHAQLQILVAEPESCIVLTSNPWMAVLKAEVRLFSGGVCIDTPHHGPHVLPFRIHLAAAAYHQIDDRSSAGLVLLRQKPDAHGYGPLALLPERPGANGEDDGPLADLEDPPLRTLSLAILVPPRSSLQTSLEEVVCPLWKELFEQCSIPCDELNAPPAEFATALSMLQAEGVLRDEEAGSGGGLKPGGGVGLLV